MYQCYDIIPIITTRVARVPLHTKYQNTLAEHQPKMGGFLKFIYKVYATVSRERGNQFPIFFCGFILTARALYDCFDGVDGP